MSTVISVSSLSKRFRIGLKEKQAETLVGQIASVIKSPWQNLKRLKRFNQFGEDDESVFWALKDISFEVKEGEMLGIIGKNGAGKSTLLKILSQITEPTFGKIEIHGRVASLLEVGTGFHPELSGRENIYMNGTILGMTRREIDSKLDEIIDFSGVEKFIDTPVKFYSSGMKVRLGFSVAAHLEPEILIIDEVLAVGDYDFQKKCLGKMEDVSKNQGRTVLFVSHNMGAITALTTNCLLLNCGSIDLLGDTKDAIRRYFSFNNHMSFFPTSGIIIELIDVKSSNVNKTPSKVFGHDEDIYLYFKLRINEDLVNIIFSLTLYSIDGTRLSTIHEKPLYFKKGELNLSLAVLGNIIVPGIYYYNLHVHDQFTDFIVVEKIFEFEIYDNGSPFFQWNGINIGKFYLNYKKFNVEYV